MDRDEINEKLTPRQRQILKVLVQEYVSSATAVGSSTIQQLGGVGVSSATIRNELATLEELGYVAQPHTSAGRIPTVKGYRYFVEQLMEEAELPLAEQRMIRHQFHQIRHDLEQWMRLSAAVLARTAQAASLVTPPRAVSSRFRHLELISINDALCLMILVLQDGSIHQEMLVGRRDIGRAGFQCIAVFRLLNLDRAAPLQNLCKQAAVMRIQMLNHHDGYPNVDRQAG